MGELLEYLVENEKSFRKQRLPALYSDFRSQKSTNPDGYQANVLAWQQGLANGALAGKAEMSNCSLPSLLVIKADPELVQSLESKQFGRPLALGTVLWEAAQDGTMMSLDEFMSRQESVYENRAASWSSVPSSILWWGLRQVGIADAIRGEYDFCEGTFVIMRNLEAVTKLFESKLSTESMSPFERTFSRRHFFNSFAGVLEGRSLSTIDRNIWLKFLARDKAIVATDDNVIRVKSSASESSLITEEDSAIASLRDLIDDLTHQTGLLTARLEALEGQARDAVTKKNRVKAMACLKSKKQTEIQLQTRYTTLSQLEGVAHKLEQAADQIQLVSVMKSSAKALKSLNAKAGGAEHVAEVLDDLREKMGEVDEVGNIITDLGACTVAIDEGEIDNEIEALEQEEKRRIEEKMAKELEEKMAGAEPPSGVMSGADATKQVDEEANLTIEGMRRMSLMKKNTKGQDREAQLM